MRIAIASDIHGNKHAFEAVIAAAEAAEADELWCLGDLVGYGGDPDRSVELAIEHCAICLAGNHDLAVVDVLSLEDFSRGAALAAQWTKETIKPETREFLLSLSPEGGAEGVGLYHASPRDPIWEYVLSGLTAELCLDTTDYRVSFIGHSHVALSFHRNEGESATGSTRREGDHLDISAGEWLINPGQHRSAARRRPPRRLADARHAAVDGGVAASRVRHRRGTGGDPGCQPSGLSRRTPSVRSIAPLCIDCSSSGWRSPPPCS
jgi:predicted phosphodiesterase